MVASVRSRTARGDEDVDAKRSRPSIGKPASCHARKERVLLFGTDQRITSGPAARTAAFRGRIHGCTRTIRTTVRFFSLAPRAPSIHGTKRRLLRYTKFGRYVRHSGQAGITQRCPPRALSPYDHFDFAVGQSGPFSPLSLYSLRKRGKVGASGICTARARPFEL